MIPRRDLLLAGSALAASCAAQDPPKVERKGRLRQGVTRGCFGRGMALEDMCKHAARLGVQGFDLVGFKDWPMVKKYGLTPSMVPGAGSIADGSNRKENHEKMLAQFRENILRAAEEKCPNVITFSGNRKGMGDEEAWENSVALLKQITPLAEDKGVTICMELLNSKVNHPDYQSDRTLWGVELCKRVGSPRFRLLYDIYHMQIMEGDVIRTIRANFEYLAHFHTAGNPGRNEITAEQELNYRPIAQAIADLGYKGFFSHEYSPKRDALQSLDEALRICDV
jgi:hydroxypyruvate isomerase